MPPKAAATTGKDNSGKKLKDLELLLACVISSANTIEVDYDEFMKHDDAPTRPAALKRVERMSKALGVTIKAAPKRAANGDAIPKAKPAVKKKTAAKKITTQSSDEDEDDEIDEDTESPSKKQKVDKDTEDVKDQEDE